VASSVVRMFNTEWVSLCTK